MDIVVITQSFLDVGSESATLMRNKVNLWFICCFLLVHIVYDYIDIFFSRFLKDKYPYFEVGLKCINMVF